MNANPSASPYVNDLQNKVRVCRSNLLLAVAFTLINIVLLASKSTRYFLFSLVVPYRFVLNGMLFGGYMPDEFYVGEDGVAYYIEKNPSLLAMLGIVAAVILGLYMLFFFMSKKNVGWLVPTLVFVSLDCLAYVGLIFLYGFEISDILDLAFHAWLLYYMIAGVAAYVKLRKLPPEAFAPAPMPLENEPWPRHPCRSRPRNRRWRRLPSPQMPRKRRVSQRRRVRRKRKPKLKREKRQSWSAIDISSPPRYTE